MTAGNGLFHLTIYFNLTIIHEFTGNVDGVTAGTTFEPRLKVFLTLGRF